MKPSGWLFDSHKKLIHRILLLFVFSVALMGNAKASMPSDKERYLVTVHDGKGKTEVIRTNDIDKVDSIMRVHNLPEIADTLLHRSVFFEIRMERLCIYAERKNE